MSKAESKFNEEHLKYLTYCGHYCGLCAERAKIPQKAKMLKDAMMDEGWHRWYAEYELMSETFPIFWNFLVESVNPRIQAAFPHPSLSSSIQSLDQNR